MPEFITSITGDLAEHVHIMAKIMPKLLLGSGITIVVIAGAMALGFLFGVPISVIQVYGPRPLRFFVSIYVWLFRGTPILVLLYIIFFALFSSIGFNINEILAVIIILGLTSTAYQSQIFRGSLLALPSGQIKAARALGMTDMQAIRSIILPQALRISIPGWSNEYSIILKDSALAYAVGCKEIMSYAKGMATSTQAPLTVFITTGVLYLIITVLGIGLLRKLERRVRIPGYAEM